MLNELYLCNGKFLNDLQTMEDVKVKTRTGAFCEYHVSLSICVLTCIQ